MLRLGEFRELVVGGDIVDRDRLVGWLEA